MRRAGPLLGFLALLCLTPPQPAWGAEDVPFRLPDEVVPTHYQLDLEILPDLERFSGEARIDLRLEAATDALWLHGRGLEVGEAWLRLPDGTQLAARYAEADESGYARVEVDRPVGPGEATLVLRYSAPFDESLQGLFRTETPQGFAAFTHMEPTYARQAFPGFDEPRFKVPFDITVTTDGGRIAVSNAPERERLALGDGRTRFAFATTAPLPTYLIALAVGDFDVVSWAPVPANAVRSWPLPLRGIAPKGEGARLAYALEQTAGLLAVLEDYFALPFPYAKLDLVAVPAFGPSGMENAGAIFYRADRILIDAGASIWAREGFLNLHAHELVHSWFGDLVTPAWWDDLWLNESFATWLGARALHFWQPMVFDDRSALRSAKEALRSDRQPGAQAMRQPMESDHDIANVFSDIVYSKGAAVLEMIEHYLGAETFRAGVRRFIARHADGVATAEDFMTALSESAGDPALPAALGSFLAQPGLPLVALDWTCDATGAAAVTLSQTRSLPLGATSTGTELWSVPLCLAYPRDGGLGSHCLVLAEKSRTVALPGNACPVWIHANGGGAAYLNFTLPPAGWGALIDALPTLPPAEQLAVLASIESAYEAGSLDTAQFLRAAEAAAGSTYADVAEAPMQGLRHLKLFIAPREARAAVLARLRAIYRGALDGFAVTEASLRAEEADIGRQRLRGELLWFMSLDADDPDLRALLSRLGQAYLGYGSDGALHPEVMHPDHVRNALLVAAGEAGPDFVERLVEGLRTTEDPVLRTHLLRALAYQTDEATVRRAFALILDPTFPGHQASELLRRLSQKADNQEIIFAWLMANWDAVLERLPPSHARWLPWRVSAFCATADHARVAAFFAPRMAGQTGGTQVLEEVLEKIALCAAIADAQRPGAVEAIAAGD